MDTETIIYDDTIDSGYDRTGEKCLLLDIDDKYSIETTGLEVWWSEGGYRTEEGTKILDFGKFSINRNRDGINLHSETKYFGADEMYTFEQLKKL